MRSGPRPPSGRASAAAFAPSRRGRYCRPTMRVIDCDCGATLQAANDDDLAARVRRHLEADHPGTSMSDEEVRALVADKAYAATDS